MGETIGIACAAIIFVLRLLPVSDALGADGNLRVRQISPPSLLSRLS
jgi:hypothetical protein